MKRLASLLLVVTLLPLSLTTVTTYANPANANTFTTGGLAEFELADPTDL